MTVFMLVNGLEGAPNGLLGFTFKLCQNERFPQANCLYP